MRKVVVQVQDAGLVLKGGGALVLAYGSIRHTTDLDFDAEEQIDMALRIRRATELIGIEIDENTWWWPKGRRGTRIPLRYKVNFFGHDDEKYRLQVDTRYHPKADASDIPWRRAVGDRAGGIAADEDGVAPSNGVEQSVAAAARD